MILRCTPLDMYNYSFIYDADRIDAIHLYFDFDDLATLASVSTDITSHDNLIFLEGKRFEQISEKIIKNNSGYILEIKVNLIQLEEYRRRFNERVQQNHTGTTRFR